MKHYDVVIIGAGTAGLSARKVVAEKTDNYIVVDDGPLGTTCARVGCMPSKVLIQVANDFDRRKVFEHEGIGGAEMLEIDQAKVMSHVRSLRDRFVRGVMGSFESWQDKFVAAKATFVDPHTLDLNGEKVKADKIIVATGSRPIIPGPWMEYRDHLIDTNSFFEQETLPESVAVIGLGVIGIELGQALNRLGVNVIGMTVGKSIGGVTDPGLQDYIAKKLSEEMPIHFNGAELLGLNEAGKLKVKADDKTYEVDKAIVSVGRRPNLDRIGLENLDISLSERGIPNIDSSTMSLKEFPHIFFPGDINADRPILHEAADEGTMAGVNAVKEDGLQCFKRRVSLGVTFSDPNIATVGNRYQQLVDEGVSFVTGEVSFEGQGRSIVKLKEKGELKVYVDQDSAKILGAELFAPDGEHMAHLLAWSISMGLTVFEALKMPFYHPVVEEGLRTALRKAAIQLAEKNPAGELYRCSDAPIR
jgi:dihydrolipoamide dehydrogenase